MSNMYDILGKLKNLLPGQEPVETAKEPVYESVESKGDIMEAVRSLEEKYMGFKKTVAAIEKGGSAENPEAVAAAIGRKKYGKKKFQKAAAQGKKLGEAAKPDYIDLDKDGNKTEPMKKAAKDAKKKTDEAFDPAVAGVAEGEYDPAPVDPAAVEKRKRLQAIKDRQEAERAEKGGDHKSNVRTIKGKAYGGAAQKDDTDDLDEVAPPGAKAERMVKHIKKGYAKDGKLTKREKGIAYATAWKAHNKGQVEEGTQFGDTIENSKAELTKAKKVKVTESRMLQEGDYFYEKVGKALAEKNPTLNTADPSFVTAVRQEMVAQGIEPNRARNIIMMDDDFISDVATSYGHYCQEIAECGAPINSHLGGAMEELDEIARLAGLPERLPNPGEPGGPPGEIDLDVKNLKTSESEEFNEQEMDEGNEFTKARLDAIAAGKNSFTVGGKEYSVSGDTSQEKTQVEEAEQVNEEVQMSISAQGDEDVVNLVRKLAGMPVIAVASQEAEPVVDMTGGETVEEERDIEWDNTPEEQTAPISASIPSGTDLHRSKKQDPATANKAANPLGESQVEESLWKKYEDMINNIKA